MLSKNIGMAMIGLSVLLLGCSKSGRDHYYASTVAPTTSTAPVTSTTPAPVVSTNPIPPPPPLLTDAMVSSFTLDEVIEVDAKAGTITNRWAVGDGPGDVANRLLFSYVANAIDQNVSVVDRLANNTMGPIDVTAAPITGVALVDQLLDSLGLRDILKQLVRPTGLAVTPDGKKVVSANLLNVTVCNTTTMAADKSLLGLNSLTLQSLISNPSQALSTFFAAPVRGLGMAKVVATNEKAFVTCMITGTVMRIDLLTNTVSGYSDVGTAPIGIALAGNKAYVACAISQDVWVLDVATGNVLSTIAAGMIPVDCAASPSGDRIYVANAVSGDISVIDTAADQVVDTLPAGLSLIAIFQQMGIQLPAGTTGGWQGALSGFLQGFATGLNNPSSFGSLLAGGGTSLLSPGNLINGLLTGFLAFAGVNQQQLNGMNMPGIGIMSLSVTENPDLVCAGNAFLGELAVTQASTRNVSTITGLTGLGPVDVAAIYPR